MPAFPAPPIRTPVIHGTAIKAPENQFSYPWMRWYQNVATQLTAPVSSQAPASSTAAGTAGQISFDSNFIYVCIAKNVWKRVALASF